MKIGVYSICSIKVKDKISSITERTLYCCSHRQARRLVEMIYIAFMALER